jgi:ABC-2 type transport system permease protein
MSRIKHYFSVYIGFLSTCFVESMSYRIHFFLLIIMDLFFYFSTLAAIDILYNHVATIGPWQREQFLFFVAVMLAINQLHMTFLSESFWMLPYSLKTGAMDFLLIKPISPLFSTFFRYIRPGSLCNIIVTWSVLIYYGMGVGLNGLDWVALPIVVILGFILAASIELIIACSMFWMLEGTGINFLRIELQQLARWPDFIYQGVLRQLLTVALPVLLIGSAPARFLFNYHDVLPLIMMISAIIMSWILLRITWRLGLIKYESASS